MHILATAQPVINADGVHYIFNENMQQILIDGEIGFCVEPGILLQPGSGFVPTAYDRREIAIIAYEGWEKSAKTAADYVATQFMIWEAVGGRITRTNFSDYGAYKTINCFRQKYYFYYNM